MNMKRGVTDVTTAQQSASVLHKMEAVEMAVTTDERAYVPAVGNNCHIDILSKTNNNNNNRKLSYHCHSPDLARRTRSLKPMENTLPAPSQYHAVRSKRKKFATHQPKALSVQRRKVIIIDSWIAENVANKFSYLKDRSLE
ncbi:unnamed protein product [Ceratitis capitata]|uniref:(Mediterranean fruit fly) hypothetical protein n=1 Tax=Ceratitis capitata TaxID=7213 RepID=A0A811UFT3_CERCA|nr:unnamed protein product [Ceratitis capitata]